MWENTIMSAEEIKKGLADRRLYKVSEMTGLSYPTLLKLANGEDGNYSIKTLNTICDYLNDSNKT